MDFSASIEISKYLPIKSLKEDILRNFIHIQIGNFVIHKNGLKYVPYLSMKSKHWSFGLYQENCSVAQKNPVNKNNTYLFLKFILQKFIHILMDL